MSPASEHMLLSTGVGVTGEMWAGLMRHFTANLTLMMMNGGELITLD